MEPLLHQVLAGVATGSIYAGIALALVMTWRATHVVNFAQGEMAMFSTYLAWAMIDAGLPYWAAFAITVVLSFLGGVAIERLLIRRLAGAPVLAAVVVLIGLLLVFNSLAGWLFTYTVKSFPSPFPDEALWGGFVSAHELGTVAITLVLFSLIAAFFRWTRLGLAMRAVADNPVSSRLVGIRVGRVLAAGWGLGAALGAVAGMLVAPIVFLDPNMMSGVLLYGFAAALLGGIDSPGGAVLGGFAVGILENLAGAYLVGTELKLSVALAVIVGVLIVKPTGLIGRARVGRV